MPTIKVTQSDGSSETIENETHKHTPVIPKFNHYQPRVITLGIILKALKFTDGETVDKLAKSTQIPVYSLNRYLLDLEKEKKIIRSGSRYYLVRDPLESD